MVDILSKAGRFLGISNAEGRNIAASLATGGIGQAALTTLQSLGGDTTRSTVPVDTSPRPAGVDSPATLSRTSQTSSFDNFINQQMDQGLAKGGPRRPQISQAFIGGPLVPNIIQGAGRLLSKPGVGGALIGTGAGLGFDVITDMFGNQKKLVITRKLQRDVKKAFMMTGGDLDFISQASMQLFGKDLSPDQLLMIMFKTFKNQGPYVTKAAVRKTRSTIRKMETLCDLKDRLCPPKPARRRAPARKMSTSITQVK